MTWEFCPVCLFKCFFFLLCSSKAAVLIRFMPQCSHTVAVSLLVCSLTCSSTYPPTDVSLSSWFPSYWFGGKKKTKKKQCCQWIHWYRICNAEDVLVQDLLWYTSCMLMWFYIDPPRGKSFFFVSPLWGGQRAGSDTAYLPHITRSW